MPRKCDAVFVSCCCCSRTTTWTHSTSSCKRSGSIRQVGAAGGLPAVANIAAQLSAVHAAEADGACALLRHAQAYLRESVQTRPSSSASVVAVARAAHASVTWLAPIGPARTHVLHARMHQQTCISDGQCVETGQPALRMALRLRGGGDDKEDDESVSSQRCNDEEASIPLPLGGGAGPERGANQGKRPAPGRGAKERRREKRAKEHGPHLLYGARPPPRPPTQPPPPLPPPPKPPPPPRTQRGAWYAPGYVRRSSPQVEPEARLAEAALRASAAVRVAAAAVATCHTTPAAKPPPSAATPRPSAVMPRPSAARPPPSAAMPRPSAAMPRPSAASERCAYPEIGRRKRNKYSISMGSV